MKLFLINQDVKVTEIGLCHPSQLGTSGVICASFNAG